MWVRFTSYPLGIECAILAGFWLGFVLLGYLAVKWQVQKQRSRLH